MYTRQPQKLFHSKKSNQATLQCHFLGPHPIIHHFIKRMNIRTIIDQYLGSGMRTKNKGITHADVLEILIHSIITAPMPLYRIREWIDGIESCHVGLKDKQKQYVNDDRIGRALDALSKNGAQNIFFHLALRIIKDFSIHTERIHFDTTSVTFYGNYHDVTKSPAITRGHNKDGRPDLKQLVFGLQNWAKLGRPRFLIKYQCFTRKSD